MCRFIGLCFGTLVRLLRARRGLLLENLALRQQLAVLKRRQPRPRLDLLDKLFWVAIRRFWTAWQQSLIAVTPETVVRWHRAGFRLYWKLISNVRRPVGRQPTSKEVRELIFRMVVENPTWGAPRIHGELLMLGFDVSERTVSRWMKRAPRDPEPATRWLTFLRNHREAIAAMDFFTGPTIRPASARLPILLLLLTICPCSASAQQGAVNHNVILRRDPSTSSPALTHLQQGARVTLVDASPDSGFYHVRTEDDQVGWVFAKYITLSQAPPVPSSLAPPADSTQCDATLWTHVYHPHRLIVKTQCQSVTGTIVDATNGKKPDGVRHEADGDTHGWLKLDPEFENLLNAGNISDEGGNLVFEIVCRFPVRQADAKMACQNYTDHVTLPAVGSHVRILGTYVQDTFHAKWMEIHPVTSITVLP